MYDFNDGCPFGGLLELLNCSAVACDNGTVVDYNRAAAKLLPSLREGKSVCIFDSGSIELCGVEFNAISFNIGSWKVYAFAENELTSPSAVPALMENVSLALINTLNASFAASELLAEKLSFEPDSPIKSVSTYAAILRHTQYKLLHIAENLRELSALESSPQSVTMTYFDLSALCSDVTDTVASLIHSGGITINYSVSGSDFTVYADRERIERMLLDIIANSIAHCSENSEINVFLKHSESWLQIVVDDNGSGIGLEILPKVFEAFSVPPSPNDRPHGAGISLSVAQSIARRHGGTIIIEPKPDSEGMRVTVSLPFNRAADIKFRLSEEHYVSGNSTMRSVLTSLSDVLGYEYYEPPYLS